MERKVVVLSPNDTWRGGWVKERIEDEGDDWEWVEYIRPSNAQYLDDGIIIKKKGSRREVWNGKALETYCGRTKNGLMKLSSGRIVSKEAYEIARRKWQQRQRSVI